VEAVLDAIFLYFGAAGIFFPMPGLLSKKGVAAKGALAGIIGGDGMGLYGNREVRCKF